MKYSKYCKGRCSRGCKLDGTQLGFGRYGTKSCRAGRLSNLAIKITHRAIIKQFNRAMSGEFRRNSKIWVRVFPSVPITGKPTKVRMGRGKGNPTGWILLMCPRDKSHLKWMVLLCQMLGKPLH